MGPGPAQDRDPGGREGAGPGPAQDRDPGGGEGAGPVVVTALIKKMEKNPARIFYLFIFKFYFPFFLFFIIF